MRERNYYKVLVCLGIVCVAIVVLMNLYMLSVVGAFDGADSPHTDTASVFPLTEYVASGNSIPVSLVTVAQDLSNERFVCSPVDTEIEVKFGDESTVVKVHIDESTVGCKPGRKNVFAHFRYSSRGTAGYISCTAFDKYTGTSFSSTPFSSEDVVQFECNGLPLGVATSRSGERKFAGQYEQEVVVNCYESYDGVMFQISPIFGDSDKSLSGDCLHTIDEFSSFGNQLYFKLGEHLDFPCLTVAKSEKTVH